MSALTSVGPSSCPIAACCDLGPITPIAQVAWRAPATVEGRIRSIRVRPRGDHPTLEVVLVDDTGGITLLFLARRKIAGFQLGLRLQAEGTVGSLDQRPAILNPRYTILATD